MRLGVFRFILSFVSALQLVCISSVQAADLLSSYQEATQNDVQWLAALSKYQQSAEFKAQAASRLLPNLSYTQGKNSVKQDTFFNDGSIDPSRSGSYPSSTKVLTLRQPVIRTQELLGLQVANAQTDRAYYALRDEEQQLAFRLVSNYLDAIHSHVSFSYAKALRSWANAYLEVVQAKVRGGQASSLDEVSALANFEKYQAQEIQATEQIALTTNQLSLQTGRSGIEILSRLDAFNLKLVRLPPLDSLLSKASEQSPKILLASMDAEIAKVSLRQARAGHLPTLDFVAQVSNNLADNPYFKDSRTNIKAVGAQLTVPLYSGGSTSSQIRSNVNESEQAEFRLTDSINKIKIQVQTEYNIIKSGLSVVRAYQTALDASKMSAEFYKLGASIGYQSDVDRLRALSEQEQAQLTLHQAKVDVIKSWFRLNAILGEIDDEMIVTFNSMFH